MKDLVQRHFTGRGVGLEFEMEADWVSRRLRGRRGRLVDVGCGIGALIDRVGGAHGAVGVDYIAEGLAHTRAQLPHVPLICASAERLPFTPGRFDVVMAQHVIEHLPACQEACRQWFAALKPGGVLLVLTPNGGFCDRSVFEDETHVRLFDGGVLGDVLRGAGFEVRDMRSLGLPWFRRYHGLPGAWRLRRCITRYAELFSRLSPLRWRGQTLCCAARRPMA